MPKEAQPELKKYMSKRLSIKLNGNRTVTGRLSGFDVFMNLVLEEAIEEVSATEKHEIGVMVSTNDFPRRPAVCCYDLRCPLTDVRKFTIALQVVRGNSIIQMEAIDRLEAQ